MHRTRHLVYGVVFLTVLALVVALTVALYDQSFTSTDGLTIKAQRAGLTMDPGAAVKLRGVQIGRVTSVASDGDGAKVDLRIDSRYMDKIPADVTAQIIPPTAFGAKYVQLTAAPGRVTDPIRAGATIGANHVTVEVNDTFEHLMDLLHAANPVEVDHALSALSTALDGRGRELGQLISQVDTYLNGLNPALPTLATDLPLASKVLGTYDKLTPDLLHVAANVTVTSNTVVSQQASLDALLLSLSTFSGKTSRFLAANAQPLQNLLAYLDPVTRTLARYAPVLPCTLATVVTNDKLAQAAVGGQGPGIYTYTELQPSDDPNTNPANLPKLGLDSGPDCHGLTSSGGQTSDSTYPRYDTGANQATPDTTGSPGRSALASTLFGTLAGLLNLGGTP